MTAASIDELRAELAPAATIGSDGLLVTDPAAFRGPLTDQLIRDAVFHADPAFRDAQRWVIWAARQALGCGSASIQDLYAARGRGEIAPTAFTVPAINVRAAAYLTVVPAARSRPARARSKTTAPASNRGGRRTRVAHMQRKSLDLPDETRTIPHGRTDIWNLGDFVVGRITFEPGWQWSKDVKPIAQTEWCEYHHLGLVMEGNLHYITPDGLEMEVGPGMLYEILPGHDAWVVGDKPVIQYDFAGMRTFALPAAARSERILATLICTDIVDSTPTAERLGPNAWRTVLAELNAESRRQIDKFRGKLADTTGDGVIAMFDGAERAIRCAAAIGEGAAKLGLGLRCGVHTGEIELIPDGIRGVAVHVLNRVTAVAGAGEVVVSGTTYELVADSELRFDDRGMHELKGVTGARRIWALVRE